MKLGKAPGSDGITAEMLKYGEVVVDWMMWICNLAWEQSKVPEDWRKAITVPLYKGKGNREECNNYRGISLLSVPGKIYGRILNDRMMKITDKSVGDEQGFQKGRGCVDQIFAVKISINQSIALTPRSLRERPSRGWPRQTDLHLSLSMHSLLAHSNPFPLLLLLLFFLFYFFFIFLRPWTLPWKLGS